MRVLVERRLTLSFPGLPARLDGLRVVFFSDVHFTKRWSKREEDLLRYLEANAFDLGCCAGDLEYACGRATGTTLEHARRVFSASKPRLGWFVVRGNNDSYDFIEKLHGGGVNVLLNRAVRLDDSDGGVYLIGVDDPHRRCDDLDAALKDVPPEAFKILLAHSPDIISSASGKGIPLILTGHTHGGQVRLPGIGAVITETRCSRKFSYGLSRLGDTVIFTTCGIGYAILPIRIGCPPEVVAITLRRGTDAPALG
jgi:hypothetical protein